MRIIGGLLAVLILLIFGGCVTSDNNHTIVISGELSLANEYQHGVWKVGITQGDVVKVTVLRTNATVWVTTHYATIPDGILILSEPEPLSIGNKYRVEVKS